MLMKTLLQFVANSNSSLALCTVFRPTYFPAMFFFCFSECFFEILLFLLFSERAMF